MSKGYRVAVVGATGQVGTLMLELLRERAFPAREIVPFASERSVGRELRRRGLIVQGLDEESIQGFDLALFSAGGSTSGEWAPRFAAAGAVVVDNSSRWRMQDDVPLVVSEVNPEALAAHHGIIANPNCSTMQMVVALKPLHDAAGIERLVITTYQAVSGTGRHAVDELLDQSHALLHEREIAPPECLRAPDRLQRAPPRRLVRRRRGPHRRGAQADQRDAQDPRRPVDPRLRDLRARARRQRPLRGRQRADARAPLPRARARAAGGRAGRDRARRPRRRAVPAGDRRRRHRTTCSSGASAATPATSARWTCGSSPTTCARAPRSTPSRSPSCCIERGLIATQERPRPHSARRAHGRSRARSLEMVER